MIKHYLSCHVKCTYETALCAACGCSPVNTLWMSKQSECIIKTAIVYIHIRECKYFAKSSRISVI